MMQTDFVHGLFGVIPSNVRAFRTNPTNNYVSTADTIAEMKQIAIASSRHPVVLQAVNIAIRNLPSDATLIAQSAAIFQWVKSHVRFVKHEQQQYELFGLGPDNQLLITPERVLTMPNPNGDCAVYSTLLAAMLIPLGVGVNFVTVGADPSEPQRYSHVYVVAKYPTGETISLDGSHGQYFGWEAQDVSKKKEWNVMPMIQIGRNERAVRQLGAIGFNGCGMGQSGEVAIETSPGAPTDIYTPPFVPYGPAAPSAGVNWGSVLTTGINTATNTTAAILKAQYGGLQPGQYVAQGPGGTVAYTLPKGGTQIGVSTFPGMDSSSLGMWLLIGGALIIGIKMLGSGGRR